ncbi:hypothetical protein BN1723_005909 [Verticillium longisporum]|uniref:Uncharacterized protein n=1 Tax=Verticillium longisporum TaxID=100787 RepID=A0A0G4M3D1_VERLO|nr:hypothetical protein BN1708_004753 [Verticillium longisporum]CRK43924.1 hypothetical protein BN1723_005909 [Verticillium longisporum]
MTGCQSKGPCQRGLPVQIACCEHSGTSLGLGDSLSRSATTCITSEPHHRLRSVAMGITLSLAKGRNTAMWTLIHSRIQL